MKILQIAPYVTLDAKCNLTCNKTGFGYMAYDIAAGLAKENQEDMLLLQCQYEEFVSDGIHFLTNNKWKVLQGLFRICSLVKLLKMLSTYPMFMGSAMRLIYQWALMGYLNKILKTGKYDVVHIHGCSYINLFIIDLCEQHKIPFVVTLHGLNAFDDSVCMEQAGKEFEKDFLRMAYEQQWTLTFISTGMKKRVIEFLGTDKADNIHVVCNSFRFVDSSIQKVNIFKKYDIPTDAKIILYVGNQGYNKNQKQMVRAFALLPRSVQENTYVLFLGRVNEDYNLLWEINQRACVDHLKICGLVQKEQVAAYYLQADATALFSFSEGFGLSLVEGMNYGLPCIAIKTMDAYEDIYNSKAVVGVEKHDDELIAEGIERLLTKSWDATFIKKHAEMFTNEQMTRKYERVLKQTIT